MPYPLISLTLVAQLGFIERENATILNASVCRFARRTIRGFENAMRRLGLNCSLFLTQVGLFFAGSCNSMLMSWWDLRMTERSQLRQMLLGYLFERSHLVPPTQCAVRLFSLTVFLAPDLPEGASFLAGTDLRKAEETQQSMVVLDCGGTTTDVCVLLPSGFPRQAAAFVEGRSCS